MKIRTSSANAVNRNMILLRPPVSTAFRFFMKPRDVFLFLISLLPFAAWACKPVVGYEYKIPSETERIAEADVVFIARSVAIEQVPEKKDISQPIYTFRVTMSVERWIKGSGHHQQIVFDTGGTDAISCLEYPI